MVKPDERLLFDAIRARDPDVWTSAYKSAYKIAAEIGIPEKRAVAILKKWTARGWWEYGCSIMGGWFTDEGLTASLPPD